LKKVGHFVEFSMEAIAFSKQLQVWHLVPLTTYLINNLNNTRTCRHVFRQITFNNVNINGYLPKNMPSSSNIKTT
jgi:hypothetical protein